MHAVLDQEWLDAELEVINPRRPMSWPSLQRFEDYYVEGGLIWLPPRSPSAVSAIAIRELRI